MYNLFISLTVYGQWKCLESIISNWSKDFSACRTTASCFFHPLSPIIFNHFLHFQLIFFWLLRLWLRTITWVSRRMWQPCSGSMVTLFVTIFMSRAHQCIHCSECPLSKFQSTQATPHLLWIPEPPTSKVIANKLTDIAFS